METRQTRNIFPIFYSAIFCEPVPIIASLFHCIPFFHHSCQTWRRLSVLKFISELLRLFWSFLHLPPRRHRYSLSKRRTLHWLLVNSKDLRLSQILTFATLTLCFEFVKATDGRWLSTLPWAISSTLWCLSDLLMFKLCSSRSSKTSSWYVEQVPLCLPWKHPFVWDERGTHSASPPASPVLQYFLEKNLFIKVEKCNFHTTFISFLGFVIGQ